MQAENSAAEKRNPSGEEGWAFIKRNIVRGIKFTIAGGAGFLIAEALIALGLVLVGITYILEIDIVAGILSVASGFVINEYWTSKNEGDHSGNRLGFAVRLFKFELVYGLGNIISFSVQIFLLHEFGLNPLIGNVAGAAAALPVNYLISMIAVWRVKL